MKSLYDLSTHGKEAKNKLMLDLFKNFSFLSDDLTAMGNIWWRDWWITSPRVLELGKAKAMRHCSLCGKSGHTRVKCGRHEGRLIRRGDLRVPAVHGTPIRSSLPLTSSGHKYRAQLVETLGEPGTPAPDTPASALKDSIVKALVPLIQKAKEQQTLDPIVEEPEVEVSQDGDGSGSDISGVHKFPSSSTETESSTDQDEGVHGGSGGGSVGGRGRGVQRHIQYISSKLKNLSL